MTRPGRRDDIKQLSSLIQDLPESCVLVFWLDVVSADVKSNSKWKSFFSAVDKAGACVDFPRKSKSELVRLLCREAQKRGCTLSPANAGLMVERAGDDLRLLMSELEKLCALAAPGEIAREHIEAIGVLTIEARSTSCQPQS